MQNRSLSLPPRMSFYHLHPRACGQGEAHAPHISERQMNKRRAMSIVKCFLNAITRPMTSAILKLMNPPKHYATKYKALPTLFYYWDGSRNKKYQRLKSYGMAKDFKPHYGRITLTSIIGRGVIHELECGESGTFTVKSDVEPCELALYTVGITSPVNRTTQEHTVLCGKTDSGKLLSENECRRILTLPVTHYAESKHAAPHWLKSSGKPHELDRLVPKDELLAKQADKLSPAQTEEVDEMKLRTTAKKNALPELAELDTQVKAAEAEHAAVTNDRLKLLALEKKANRLRQEYLKKQESQFLDAMRLDLELERQVKEFTEKEKLTAKVTREFVLKVEGVL
jgi:hypothetical protein